eukprot:1810444-Rhodomonas_salina.2
MAAMGPSEVIAARGARLVGMRWIGKRAGCDVLSPARSPTEMLEARFTASGARVTSNDGRSNAHTIERSRKQGVLSAGFAQPSCSWSSIT